MDPTKKGSGKGQESNTTERNQQEKGEEVTVDDTNKEDEDMANVFEETLKILDGPDKEKFMKMNDHVKRKYIKYLEQIREQDSDSASEDEEEQTHDAKMQGKRDDNKDQGDEEEQLFES